MAVSYLSSSRTFTSSYMLLEWILGYNFWIES